MTLPRSLTPSSVTTFRRELTKAAGAVERLKARVRLMRQRLEQAEGELVTARRTLALLAEAAIGPDESTSTPDDPNRG